MQDPQMMLDLPNGQVFKSQPKHPILAALLLLAIV